MKTSENVNNPKNKIAKYFQPGDTPHETRRLTRLMHGLTAQFTSIYNWVLSQTNGAAHLALVKLTICTCATIVAYVDTNVRMASSSKEYRS